MWKLYYIDKWTLFCCQKMFWNLYKLLLDCTVCCVDFVRPYSVHNSDFCSLSCSIGFKIDEPSRGNWRERFHPSAWPASQTSLSADPIQITGNKANECPVRRWKATLEIIRQQLPVVNGSQSCQTVYPSSTLTSSQSDLLSPQDYRTAVPHTDTNHTNLYRLD